MTSHASRGCLPCVFSSCKVTSYSMTSFSLITSAKTLFPIKVIFPGIRGWDMNLSFGGGHNSSHGRSHHQGGDHTVCTTSAHRSVFFQRKKRSSFPFPVLQCASSTLCWQSLISSQLGRGQCSFLHTVF